MRSLVLDARRHSAKLSLFTAEHPPQRDVFSVLAGDRTTGIPFYAFTDCYHYRHPHRWPHLATDDQPSFRPPPPRHCRARALPSRRQAALPRATTVAILTAPPPTVTAVRAFAARARAALTHARYALFCITYAHTRAYRRLNVDGWTVRGRSFRIVSNLDRTRISPFPYLGAFGRFAPAYLRFVLSIAVLPRTWTLVRLGKFVCTVDASTTVTLVHDSNDLLTH